MSDQRPNLGDFFGQGPKGEDFRLNVFTLRGTEQFDIYMYRLDTGYLILYRAQDGDNNSIRLRPFSVFAPGGWIGYAWADDEPPASRVGFQPNPTT